MFQWHYFFLFIFLGFACGYTNPQVPTHRYKPISNIFGLISIITFVGFIWNIFEFGIFWGILTALEIWVGYILGRKLSIGD